MRGLLLALVAAGTLGSGSRQATTEAYLALVLQYSRGEHAPAASALARWTVDDLQRALRDLRIVLPGLSKRQEVSEAALVATAMVVHLDIARQSDTNEEADRHLAIGQRLSELLPPEGTDGTAHFRARWHHAAGVVLFGFSRPDAARRQLDAARALRPGDSAVLLALGSAYEIDDSSGGSADERLAEAAKLYEASLVGAPASTEARLRLARTQHLLGRLDAAAATVAPVLAVEGTLYLRYLARLIGAGISDAQGRADEAAARYREARSLCDRCPSAMLGLSRALLRAGNREEARALVDRLVADGRWLPPGDPWWMYRQGQWHEIERIVRALREAVPK